MHSLSKKSRQNIAGVASLICVVSMVLCISWMIPNGLAGNIRLVKVYFAGMMAAAIVGLPTTVAYVYYRNNSQEDASLERMRAAVGALGGAGQKPPTARPQAASGKRPAREARTRP